jgi:2-polyprenyl-6-hydroxyphenyl methylase/3-demethylubiquinone-9 3-methyltransferase
VGYYREKLSGLRLRECYETAPTRARRYLEAEVRHLLSRIEPGDEVLELGCGYGRVLLPVAAKARRAVGIDTAPESLDLGRELAGDIPVEFIEMDATSMTFPDASFDLTACVQNGICAFGVDRPSLVREAIRVTRPGGRVIFSSYSPRFWEDRLEWFEAQAARGLLGLVDREASRDGVIVCADGFRAGALDAEGFTTLLAGLGLPGTISEVDHSSVFCEIAVPEGRPDTRG